MRTVIIIIVASVVPWASLATAQPRMIVTGQLATVEVSLQTGAVRPLSRPGGSTGGVSVAGGRYIVSVVRNGVGAPVVHAWGPRTGEFLTTAPLPGTAADEWPVLAGDSVGPRAFIWNQQTLSRVTAAGVTPLAGAIIPPSTLDASLPRLLAYAPLARRIFLVRAAAGALELAQFDDAGTFIRASPLTGVPLALAVTSDASAVFINVATPGVSKTITRVDPATGVEIGAVDLPPRGFLSGGDQLVLDEANRRVLNSNMAGLDVFSFDLAPINSFPFLNISPSGACRFDVGADERTGMVVAATTARPYPYVQVSRTPIVTALDVVEPAVIGAVALAPSPDATVGPIAPCGGGSIVLTPPVAPTLNAPVVNGTSVTLSWAAVRDTASYLVEAGVGAGGPGFTMNTGSATSLTVTNVPPGTYWVRVRGVNDSGLGVLSASVMVTVP